MAEIRVEMRRFLQQDTTVMAVLDEIYVDKLPDNVSYPCAMLRNVTEPLTYNQDGSYSRRTLVQIDIYAETSASKDAAKDAIMNKLSGHRGMMGAIEVGFIFVRDAGRDTPDKDAQLNHKILEAEVGA